MSRPPRIPHYGYRGVQRYFVTICTLDRIDHFRHENVVRPVIDQFLETAREQRFTVVAYCAMPDHLHLLVDGESDDSDFKIFMKLGKQHSGYEFKKRRSRRLWQEGYYDHVLRVDEKSEDVIYYIITNPVRSGLVNNLVDYPFWGSGVYSRQELLVYIGYRG
jgi:putative transposase